MQTFKLTTFLNDELDTFSPKIPEFKKVSFQDVKANR